MEDTKSVLTLAGDRIRETAKWLTVSLAVLGGILLAGTQLSSIGSLEPGSERFMAALYGGGGAAVGTLLILGATVLTASTTPVRLAKVKLNNKKLNDPALLEGRSDVGQLKKDYEAAVAARKNAIAVNVSNPTQETADDAKAADANAVYLSGVVQNVLQVASYYKLAKTWRWAAGVIGLGAVIAAIGLVFFIWAANPAEDAKGSLASPVVIGNLSEQSMQLLPAGQEALGRSLGNQCPTSKPLKVLLLSGTDAGPDVVVQQENCNRVRLVLGSEWGTLLKPAATP
jgi:hypothetical protein